MPEKSNGSALGFVARLFLAAILLIVGVYQIMSAFNDDDPKGHIDSTVIMNEFVSDENGVEFCVTKVENLKSVGSGYLEVTTEYNFVVVSIKIVNNSTEPYDVNTLRFVLMSGKTEYEYDTDAILALEDAMYLDTVNPGITKEYRIVYETPISTDDGEFVLKIEPIGFADDDYVYIALKETK